ncbi:class I SAM-dependent methyltransferase [Streptomyces sp. NPDC087532]|uniref:class I SAM-dependent methyltransferase n=1 Tax=unclassified Streptomyces TaxID=2593676 RepID=UPI00341AC263
MPDNSASQQRFYDRTAEYVAVLIPSAWQGLGPALGRALDGLDTSLGPVVDVGAGTGEGTVAIAQTLPATEIVAVEPHPSLRTALLARLASGNGLPGRVTVLGEDILSATLPEQISGLVAMNVIGHLTPAERNALWTLLTERLAPRGRAVLNIYPPTRPESVPSTPMSETTLGRRLYTASASAEPAGTDSVTWHMTYRIVDNGTVVNEFTASDLWHVFTSEELSEELIEHDLHLTSVDADHGLHVITHAGEEA